MKINFLNIKKQKQNEKGLKFDQFSNATCFDRYPILFKRVKKVVGENKKILSFGCSTGEEVESLKKIYFKKSKVYGYDLNEKVIEIAKKKYDNEYYSKYEDVKNKSFDVIFCCSVLCQFPNWEDYSFERFEETIKTVDELLEVNGHLIIYNTSFNFKDTKLFKEKYQTIKIDHAGLIHSAMVPLRNKNSKIIEKKNIGIVFKKVKK